MISVTSAQLSAWLALFLFPFVRILALVASAPVLGDKQLPVRVKVALSMLLTFLIAPTLPPIPDGLDPGSAAGVLVLMQQVLAGVAMGFILRIVFVAAEMAGELTGMQMGLGFASFYDPQNASFTPVLGQFLDVLATLVFLGMDGHLYMLAALADSFQAFPISAAEPHASSLHTLAVWGGTLFSDALQLSMPAIGALLITNLALAILTRSAPQLNIFAIGFPITLTIGFAVLMLSLPYIAPLLERVTSDSVEVALSVMRQMGGTAPR